MISYGNYCTDGAPDRERGGCRAANPEAGVPPTAFGMDGTREGREGRSFRCRFRNRRRQGADCTAYEEGGEQGRHRNVEAGGRRLRKAAT